MNLSFSGVGQVSLSDIDPSQFGETSSNSECRETFSIFELFHLCKSAILLIHLVKENDFNVNLLIKHWKLQ